MTRSGIVIPTARLRLRPFYDSDLDSLVKLIGDWDIARWVSSVPHPYGEADGRNWIESVRRQHAEGRPLRFAIALQQTDCLIGGIGLNGDPGDDSGDPALGYWLGKAYWGNGYAREAVAAIIDYGFDILGIETIRAYADPENTASQNVLRRCGLKNVGNIELRRPTRNGARIAPLFCIARTGRGKSGLMR